MKHVTREGFEYELTVNFEIVNDNHLAVASKDRTGLFMNKPEFVISKGTGKILKEWCNNGKSKKQQLQEIQLEIIQCTTLQGLRHIYTKYPNFQIEIKDNVIQRKAEIENVSSQIIPNNEIIQTKTIKNNGIDSSNTTSNQ